MNQLQRNHSVWANGDGPRQIRLVPDANGENIFRPDDERRAVLGAWSGARTLGNAFALWFCGVRFSGISLYRIGDGALPAVVCVASVGLGRDGKACCEVAVAPWLASEDCIEGQKHATTPAKKSKSRFRILNSTIR